MRSVMPPPWRHSPAELSEATQMRIFPSSTLRTMERLSWRAGGVVWVRPGRVSAEVLLLTVRRRAD